MRKITKNYVASVKLAADQCDKDQLPFILCFRGKTLYEDETISTGATLDAEAFALAQRYNETVLNYSKRAQSIQQEMCYSAKHEAMRNSEPAEWMKKEIEKIEKKKIVQFKSGLTESLCSRVSLEDKDTLPTIIEKAVAAEASFLSVIKEKRAEKFRK